MVEPWLHPGWRGRCAVLAHRGGMGPSRENTLEAFSAARRAGADGVELDVRRCADGSLVVVHDAVVPGVGPVHACRREDLPDWVPSLTEALDVSRGMVVDIEVKSSPFEAGHDPDQRAASGVAELLAGRAGEERLVVSCFWPQTLQVLTSTSRRAGATVPTALLVDGRLDVGPLVAVAAEIGCSAVNVEHRAVGTALVGSAHRAGLAVMAYTVNDAQDIQRVVAAGVDAVITDRVDLARQVLAAGAGRAAADAGTRARAGGNWSAGRSVGNNQGS